MVISGGAKGADLLKLARAVRKFTQLEVATAYGVDVKTYRSWEMGTTQVSYDDLCALLDGVFGLDLDLLRGMAHAA